MEKGKRAELVSFLKSVPFVEFCCVYGSTLHPNNKDKSAMVDYILGVSDPLQWHSQVHILVDNLDIANTNSVNLRAALSAALLLLPSKFTQEDLFAKICSLSYMGDLRMLFAEDKNKVKKIVQGQFDLFHSMYKPFLQEYEAKDFLRVSLSGTDQANISQDCGLPVTCSLVSSLPPSIRSHMGKKLGQKKIINEYGQAINEVIIGSREEASKCMQGVLRRIVMISSARQAVSGLLAVGGINATRYLANKMQKAWKSWT
ncbi:phosphatidate cytidylyltransferase, mitochondrial-like isoform X2 [Mangifera indica]|uniref:phosphatidate cytidylyltransferase, mitochondrial-like isoform X2 n=1 Tax=Mangifera indica TaxID=29780 RepID=UPI001CFA5024|nr:phosphatidate cytidylyltransferase, mitochondrial-like isoform X2 [Mangifera indica]